MKTLLAIILSLFFSQVSIAQSPETKTIPITPSYVIPTKNDPIIINLESASLDSPYTGNEVIEIYNANGTPVTPSQFNHCSLNRCGRSFPNNRPESLLINDLPKYPLIISTNPNTKQGIYTIAVRDSSSKKIIHRRTLTLIAPAPDLKSFKVEYSNGTSSSNKLIIPESQSLAGTKFIFEGLSLDQDFESIKLGDLRLTKMSKPELSNVFVADKSWSVLNLKKLDISNLKIYIKQFNVSKPYERQILVEAPLPIIGRIDPIPLNPGTRSFNLNLSISNLFENAQIRLTEVNKQDILRLEGTLDGAISNPQANQLTYRIELNDGALNSGISTFMVQIVNPDGNTSEPKIVQIEVQKASIIASPIKETLPFVESIQAQVKFTRGEGAPSFLFSGQVAIEINDSIQVLNPEKLNANFSQFLSKVTFPLNTVGPNVAFKLFDENNSWVGYFDFIEEIPTIIESNRIVYPGTNSFLDINKPNVNVKASLTSPTGVNLDDDSFSDSRIRITTESDIAPDTTFTVMLHIFDHLWKVLDYQILAWPKPEEGVSLNIKGNSKNLNPSETITLTRKESLNLNSQKNTSSIFSSKTKAQLIKADGTKLGEPQPLVKNSNSTTFATILTPFQFGLKGGDEFTLLMTNPSQQPFNQKFYIKRTFPDNIIVQAGLSAVNIFLDDKIDLNDPDLPSDNDTLPRSSIISGVNLGAYFLPEWTKSQGKRPLGFGINAHAQSNDESIGSDIEFRYGFSILLFETLSMGFTFKKDTPSAFFIGANATFLDFAQLFTKKEGNSP